ncbi:MAG: 1-phosphofructokinase family hexose kinase [Actinomycetota bacterium]
MKAHSTTGGPADPASLLAVIACPNLSLDRTIRVELAALGKVHRSIASDVRGGGKGVNVARALKCMGHGAQVAGISAGRTGRTVLALLDDEGLGLASVKTDGETRSCLTVLSESPPTVFNEAGPTIDESLWVRYEEVLAEHLSGAGTFVASGSLPPGAPEHAVARTIERAAAAGCTTICDTSGIYLAAALEARPDVIKPNLPEALALLGEGDDEPVDAPADAIERAREVALELLGRGPKAVVVTVGAAGVAYASDGEVHALSSPQVEVVNPVGAGDCFVAGLVMELGAHASLHDAIRTGVAMGAASCETFAAGLVDPERVRGLRAGLRD